MSQEITDLIRDMRIYTNKYYAISKSIDPVSDYQYIGDHKLWNKIDNVGPTDLVSVSDRYTRIYFCINKKKAICYIPYYKIWKTVKITKKLKFIFTGPITEEFLEDLIKERPELIFQMDVIQRLQKMFSKKNWVK